jgi:hypothetical protein
VQLNKALEGLVSQPLFFKYILTDWMQIDIIIIIWYVCVHQLDEAKLT